MLFSKLQKSIQSLIKKAEKDEGFKKELLAHPNELVQKELGEPLPENLKIDIDEETINTTALLLSYIDDFADELSEIQLQGISGGAGGNGGPLNLGGYQPPTQTALALQILKDNPGITPHMAAVSAMGKIRHMERINEMKKKSGENA